MNSIATRYAQHQDEVEAGTAGSDWVVVGSKLASILKEGLQELGLDPPLVDAWSGPGQIPIDLPVLIVIHESSSRRGFNSCMQRWTHRGRVVVIFGSEDGDQILMQAAGEPYIWAINEILQQNQTLEYAVEQIVVGRMPWGKITLPDGIWYGLGVEVEIEADEAWVRQG